MQEWLNQTANETALWQWILAAIIVGVVIYSIGVVADHLRIKKYDREARELYIDSVRPASDTLIPKPRKEDGRG